MPASRKPPADSTPYPISRFSLSGSPWWKRLLFVGAPVLVAVLLGVGVYISRIDIDGWVRVYGLPKLQPGSRAAFRVLVREGKYSTPASPVRIKTYLNDGEKRHFIGESTLPAGVQAAEVNTVLPVVAQGRHRIEMQVTSPHLEETVAFPVEITSRPGKLEKVSETRDEPEGNYVLMQSSVAKPDIDGVVVSLHPVNGRGLKMPFRDVLFLRAQDAQGVPLRARANLKLLRGRIRLPKTADCNPPFSRPEAEPCMLEIEEGKDLPFQLETDVLGLASMSLYTMTPGVSFRIEYRVQNASGEWGAARTVDFDVGIVQDDVFVAYFPRILPPGNRFEFPFRGLGKGPMYVDIYSETAWLYAGQVPLEDMFGQASLVLEEPAGLRKLQVSLFYMPVDNSTVNTTFWVHSQMNNPRILEQALRMAQGNDRLDTHTLQHLSALIDGGYVWRPGYDIHSDIHYFAGLLDTFHFAPQILVDTKQHKEAVLSRMKRGSQRTILLLMGAAAILLMGVILAAVVLSLRARRRAHARMSEIQQDENGEEHFWRNLNSSPEERRERTQTIAFGVVLALLLGFLFAAFMWVFFNIKWEM